MASLITLTTSSFPSACAWSRGVLPSLSVTSCNPLSMHRNPCSSNRTFIPVSLPWNAAQCIAFQPSLSTIAGFDPRAVIFRRADCEPFAPMAAKIMMGVQPLSFVWWFAFDLFISNKRGLMSASAPMSHVSSSISSNDRLSIFFTGLPLPSTTVSSSVRSSRKTSPKILSSTAEFNPLPINRHFARAFSNRFRGPMMVCMARPTTIPLYRCKPTVMHIPKRVLPRRDRAWEITCSDQVVSVYCLPLALGSSKGCGGGGTYIRRPFPSPDAEATAVAAMYM
mmetsp:Transcript_32516/g.66480  ORF Transcript_32516/g.66480 Transcript_32516/m.66480 type:complete len:280 (+) Transcript_32516:249-1088(+)